MIDGGGAEGRWIWWDGADDGWIKIWSSLSVFFSFWEKSDPPSISDFFFRHWLTSLPDLLASVTVNRRIPQPPGSLVCVHSAPLHPPQESVICLRSQSLDVGNAAQILGPYLACDG